MSQHQPIIHMYNLLCLDAAAPQNDEPVFEEPSWVELVFYTPHPSFLQTRKKTSPASHFIERVNSKFSSFGTVQDSSSGAAHEFGRLILNKFGEIHAEILAAGIKRQFFPDDPFPEYIFVPNEFRNYIVVIRISNPNPEYELSLDHPFNPKTDQLLIIPSVITLLD